MSRIILQLLYCVLSIVCLLIAVLEDGNPNETEDKARGIHDR